MAQNVDTLGVALGHDGQIGIALDAVAGIDQLAVELAGERSARQAGADGLRHLGDGDRPREALHRAVRELDVWQDVGRRDWTRTNDPYHVKVVL